MERALSEVDDNAKWLAAHPKGTNYDLTPYSHVLPLHFRGPVHDEVRPAGAAIYRSTSLRVQGQVAVTRTGRLFTVIKNSCSSLGLRH